MRKTLSRAEHERTAHQARSERVSEIGVAVRAGGRRLRRVAPPLTHHSTVEGAPQAAVQAETGARHHREGDMEDGTLRQVRRGSSGVVRETLVQGVH